MPAQPPRPLTAYGQLSAAQGAKFDRLFMGWMMSDMQASATMANSTFYGGKNAEVKAFARQVEKARTADIAKLRSWGGLQFSVAGMVEPQGGDHDRWFLTALPAQNEQLRQLLLLVPTHTQNANLHQFAAGLLPKLDAENIHARALLKTLK